MNFKEILAAQKNKTCILSVEKITDSQYGNIRIVEGNKAHYADMLNTLHHPFVPDSPYEVYFPKDKNFEDFCFRSAFLGQPLHTYVPLPQMGLWLNMFLLPLESDNENIGYCMYSYDVTVAADSEQQASLSADTSSAVIQTCIKLRGAGTIESRFKEVVDDIRSICNSDHCCILLTDTTERKCTTFAESIKAGSNRLPMDYFLSQGFYEVSETWLDTIGDSTCVIIKDKQDMDWLKGVNPVWHKSLTEAGVENVVLFPLNYNGETLGFMWALNYNVENTVKIKETLELTSFFIASEISNYKLVQKLEKISSMDILTGVMNRNTMNNDVDAIASGNGDISDSYAVVFADVNWLKRINDEKGHDAGDELLKNATNLLRATFPNCNIYRAGGDEFMILTSGMSEAEVEEKTNALIERSQTAEDVSLSIGMHMVNPRDDIRMAMRLADEKMYKNKNDYYIKNPDKKYR